MPLLLLKKQSGEKKLKIAGLGLSIDLIAAVGFAKSGTPSAKARRAINPAAGDTVQSTKHRR
jgi:hypothetical protein